MTPPTTERTKILRSALHSLYDSHVHPLPFHGWHHIVFVTAKATEVATAIGADIELTQAAALTHDLNYIVRARSATEAGQPLRDRLLAQSRFDAPERARIERVISESDVHNRSHEPDRILSPEAQALSDADSLVKALPTTPILFSHRYLDENSLSLEELAQEIVSEQTPLLEANRYFYSDYARNRYLRWAEINLLLWQTLKESLDDPDVRHFLKLAQEEGLL